MKVYRADPEPQLVFRQDQWREPLTVWGVYYDNQEGERVLMVLGPEAAARMQARLMPAGSNPVACVALGCLFGIARDQEVL